MHLQPFVCYQAHLTAERLAMVLRSVRDRRFRRMAAMVAATAIVLGGTATAASAQTPDLSPIGAQENAGSTLCMKAQQVNYYPGYTVVLASCSRDPNQEWAWGTTTNLTGRNDGPYGMQIVNVGTTLCLWAASWQAYNGGGLYLMPCNANDRYQLWHVIGTHATPRDSIYPGQVWQNVGTANLPSNSGDAG